MLHNWTRRAQTRHGHGIVASRPVPRGTVVWGACRTCADWSALDLQGVSPSTREWLEEFGYGLADGGLRLPCGGAHLLNHACDANVLDAGLRVGIAVRDIGAEEEVTIDYRTFRHENPWTMRCECDGPMCVGTVRSTDPVPDDLAFRWADLVAAALEVAPYLPQELPLRTGSIAEHLVEEVS